MNKIIIIYLVISFTAKSFAAPITNKAILYSVYNSVNIVYENIFSNFNAITVRGGEKYVINFNDNVYQPVLIHFSMYVLPMSSSLTADGKRVLEEPVLIVLPGDSVAIEFDEKQYAFIFTGPYQAELDLCKKIWKNNFSLSWLHFEMDVLPTKVPLDQYLNNWCQLKQQGEALIAEVGHTPGVRPAVAACLAREIRLRIFQLLILPSVSQRERAPLIALTQTYIDSVAVAAKILSDYDKAPPTGTVGLLLTLSGYLAHQCVAAGHYPTAKAKYLLAKQQNTGFRKAWLCFYVIEDARRHNKNISWLLQDYQRWAQPYNEFVRVLKGEHVGPLRSYKTTIFTDSLTDRQSQHRILNDLLERYRGQVVLLDLWASWCLPCLDELPFSEALANKYRSQGLVVLFLSVDRDPVKWQQSLKRLPKSVRNIYRFSNSSRALFMKELEVTSIPRYVLIDRHGQIRYPDALRPSDPRLEPILEKLLKL